ncbi:MAG: RHS repeat-associated core domain-containing protein, partial [Planctomycetaceae bacterium]|nr:RHS repeat-associated core domain-containing protein [Planctomycetaceae bacterium]
MATGDLAGGTSTELAYDGAGRQYQSRTVLQLESTKYSSGAFNYRDPKPHPARSSMSGGDDQVVLLAHSEFDAAGHAIGQHTYEMIHNDTGANLGIDLSNNDDYVRRTVYSWYDDAHRLIATGDYGSGDTAAGAGKWKYAAVPARPGSAPGSSSDTVLVTQYAYESHTAWLSTVTDGAGRRTRTFYDDLGRTVFVAENFDDFTPSNLSTISDGGDSSKDRVTKTEYNGLGQTTKLIAYNGSSSDAQTTQYLYEDAVDASRVTNTIYPDSSDTTSSGSDQVKVAYNVDGSVATRTDQRGTVIAFSYDNLRRPQSQKVTNLGGATDGAIRSITTKYDTLGRVSKLTSHGNQTDNPDDATSIQNQVVYTYNHLSQITQSEQSHQGAVSSSPSVQYAYATSASGGVFNNDIRPITTTYPSGRVLFYGYSTLDGLEDRLSIPRVLRETDVNGAILVDYPHLGSGRTVITDYQQPDLKLDHYGGTSGTYAGLDRFGRTIDHRWYDYTSGTVDRARYYYGYDYASNRTWKEDPVAAANTVDLDDLYAYDGLHRLTAAERGDLNGGKTAISTLAFAQGYGLDQLNNWANFTEDDDGDAMLDLDQSRDHNDANEITDISETIGPAWATPAHDAAGNMTTIPQPAAPTSTYTLAWDAWNRLVKVADGMSTVAEHEYDALNRRIVKRVFVANSRDHDEHFYLSEQNQVLEVRLDSSSNPQKQFTWGTRFVDDLVLRTRDTDNNGSLDETIYALQDANWHITAVAHTDGSILERLLYDPYGKSTILNDDFSLDGDGESDYDWETRFTSREFDPETGLHYFRARYYHDRLGRFLRRDPEGYVNGANLHCAYFPPTGVDPTGLVGSGTVPTGNGCHVNMWTGQSVCCGTRGTKWTCYDFVCHYLRRSGTSVSLGLTGLFDQWKDSVSSQIEVIENDITITEAKKV